MKVLVIWRLLTVGGVNAGWRNRSIYFKKHNIHTEFLYTTDHGGLHIMQDVAPVYLTKDDQEIISIIKKNKYDAIIVTDTGAAYKWLTKAKYKGPVIVEARTPELIKLIPHLKNFRNIKPLAIIVPSQYQKRLVSILIDELPVHVIYNGVDTSFFRALPDEAIHKDRMPVLPDDKKIVSYIGRLDKRKNWPMLLEVAKKVKRERNDVEFWVIGGAQSIQRDEFAAKWQEEGLTDIVKWFPVIPYQEMHQLYAKIRKSGGCTLATTRSESFGNTFIESMVCGVPVVASNIMPITELVINGKTGLLYYGQNVDDAVKQLYKILDNKELHEQMSKDAIEHAKANFAIDVVASQYAALLKSLVYPDKSESGEVNPS